jgi:hypothetical protein
MKTILFYLPIAAILLLFQTLAFSEIKWEPIVKMDELFPSYIISTATMKNTAAKPLNYFGDWHGQIGAALSATAENTLVRVTVGSTKLIKPSRQDARLQDKNKTYFVYPVLEYDYDMLYSAREPFPETVTIQVARYKDAADKNPARFSKKLVVQVRSINDCPRLVRHKDGNEDLRWMFGAYVNENHRVIEEILQEALKTGIVNSFNGYHRDEANAALQVFAIWNVLQQRGIKYSSITNPSGYSKKVLSQHVRFIGDSLNYQQSNCVDGSVLFASIYWKITLDPFLVLVPGHCFVGVWLDRKRTEPFYLETTLLGSTVTKELHFKEDSFLSPLNKIKGKSPTSFNTFVAAQASASKKHRECQTNPATKAEMQIIDIADCRKRGIQPLKDAYQGRVSQKDQMRLR